MKKQRVAVWPPVAAKDDGKFPYMNDDGQDYGTPPRRRRVITDEDWKQYEQMVIGAARSFSMSTGINEGDLIGVGHTTFMRCQAEWNNTQGVKFGTLLYRALRNSMIDFSQRSKLAIEDELDEAVLTCRHVEWRPDQALMFKEAIAELSEEARYVVDLILHAPAEVWDELAGTPRHVRGHIQRHLLEDLGWTRAKTWKTMGELKEAFSG